MLLLWDHVVKPRAGALDALSRADLGELTVSAIDGTTALFDPPFAEYFPPEAAALITSASQDCRASAPQWRLDEAYLTGFTDALDALQTVPMRPGCGPLTMAALSLVDGVVGDLTPEIAREALSSCYEAVLLSQLTGRVTTEQERENERCRRAIELQLALIARFAGD
ncbi:hypothetical protein [Kibdelosporangium phytohabitans]|uniref:Uncharacterized protein n=1 Tax=Kibdelosporangium phytohabitans TaxID=860235 RepID=A0A0N9I0Z4_9PSEU|nr:hypothetical protein [Kibdelosporangium phytohabitans]ALG08339.1 hypothetical protein AOZ06_16745 [Kibdelosporangium phytohabitans]MBE1470628.1 hypothetical protein [Kibdelosporangium phytohabitans]